MKRLGVWTASAFACAIGCGDDKVTGPLPDSGSPRADAASGGDAMQDAAVSLVPGLDLAASADEAANTLCALAPWVLASITARELPKEKITNTLRDDVQVFIDDKPPICVDDKDAGEDLCDEMPTAATTYTYLYRGDGAAATDPVQQVWCKSENFEDLARIPGVGVTKKGSCEGLHDLVVAWAEAQLKSPSKRSIRYEANLIERGSVWKDALVVTTEEGDVLVANSPELYADTKEVYIANNGAPPSVLTAAFFGNHYCKLIGPSAALAWLSGG